MATFRQKSNDIKASLEAGLLSPVEAAGHLLQVHGDFLIELEKMLDIANEKYPESHNCEYENIFDWLWHQFKEKDNV